MHDVLCLFYQIILAVMTESEVWVFIRIFFLQLLNLFVSQKVSSALTHTVMCVCFSNNFHEYIDNVVDEQRLHSIYSTWTEQFIFFSIVDYCFWSTFLANFPILWISRPTVFIFYRLSALYNFLPHEYRIYSFTTGVSINSFYRRFFVAIRRLIEMLLVFIHMCPSIFSNVLLFFSVQTQQRVFPRVTGLGVTKTFCCQNKFTIASTHIYTHKHCCRKAEEKEKTT